MVTPTKWELHKMVTSTKCFLLTSYTIFFFFAPHLLCKCRNANICR